MIVLWYYDDGAHMKGGTSVIDDTSEVVDTNVSNVESNNEDTCVFDDNIALDNLSLWSSIPPQ